MAPRVRSHLRFIPLPILAALALASALVSSVASPAGAQSSRPAIRVAFVRGGNIWLLNDLAGTLTRLTNDGHDSSPIWLAGGRLLQFQRLSGNRSETIRWQPGRGLRQVRDGLWSPDGAAVAVTRPGRNGAATVWVRRNGHVARVSPIQPHTRWLPLAWSPDSTRLALARYAVTGSAASGKVILLGAANLWLTTGAARLQRLPLPDLTPGHPGWPDIALWSPDGRFITVGVGPDMPCDSCRADGRPYYAIPVAGGKTVLLGNGLDPDEAISWARDGSYAVLSGPAGRQTYTGKHLMRTNSVTGVRDSLSTGTRWSDVEPAVSPNGKQIAFARGRALFSSPHMTTLQAIESRHLYLMGSNGAGLHRLTDVSGWTDEAPVWSPDGRWLLFVRWRSRTRAHAAEATLWAIRVGGTGAQLLARIDLPAQFVDGFGYYGSFGWRSLFAV